MDDLEQAVTLALDPKTDPETKARATKYCQDFKESADAWLSCLALFNTQSRHVEINYRKQDSRFFALQVVEETARQRYHTLSLEQRQHFKSSLWSYFNGTLLATDPTFIKTKFSLVAVLVFKQEYSQLWTDFISSLSLLVQENLYKAPALVDMFLRICKSLDEEIVCKLISRSEQEFNENLNIKDAIRTRGIGSMVATWKMICTLPQPSLVIECLQVASPFIQWTDISLYLNQEFMGLLYQFCLNPDFRMGALDCVTQIVSKGMKLNEKLALIENWKIPQLIASLVLDDDEEFKEKVAFLINVVGQEFIKIIDFYDAKTSAINLLIDMFPRFLALLADEYDDTSCQLFPMLANYVNLLRKMIKENQIIPDSLTNYNISMFRVVLMKLKCDPDQDDDEFDEVRKALKSHFVSIIQLDRNLLEPVLEQALIGCFNEVVSPGVTKTWTELELGLYLLYIYGEVFKATGVFFDDAGNPLLAARMLDLIVTSSISNFPNDKVTSAYFELISRYSAYFDLKRDLIPMVLMSFLRGLKNPSVSIRYRAFYLFGKFIKQQRSKIDAYIDEIIMGIQDLLIVQQPQQEYINFDSQLYLFEAVGVLISSEHLPIQKQVDYLSTFSMPILNEIQKVFSMKPIDQDQVVYLARLVLAVGHIIKGFPDLTQESIDSSVINPESAISAVASTSTPSTVTPGVTFDKRMLVSIFKQILNGIIVILQELNQHQVIREAVRSAFQFMVGCLGPDLMEGVHSLIKAGLLPQGSVKETVDFMNFTSLICFKFKLAVFDTMNQLLIPLFEKVFFILNQTPTGTDDAVLLLDMRKAYLNLLSSLFNAELEQIFTSQENQAQMNVILQSILHYTMDSTDIYSQRLAFSVLHKCIITWSGVSQELANDPAVYQFVLKIMSVKAGKSTPEYRYRQKLNGFDEFTLVFVLPMALRLFANSNRTSAIASETAMISQVLHVSLGQQWLDRLKNGLVEMGWPFEKIQEWIQTSKRMDLKRLIQLLK